MVYKLLLALVLCFGSAVYAQNKKGFEKPDYKNIERITKDKSSPSYYPKLMKRYEANDVTLTADDHRLLYYGFFFQPGYRPSGSSSKYNDSLKAIFKKQDITDADRRNAIRYTLDDLKTSPFSLKDIYRLYNLYELFKDEKNTAIYLYKLEKLAQAISSTGDAMTDTTGLHILSIEDEYTVISLLGYEFSGSQSRTPNGCEYLLLRKNEDGIEGLYFDVKQILAMSKK
ncbi:MAG: hypothetical protein K0Q79_1256 [Flavipsychrobacter sp.]|jgi:hypothetical protein|nr:hypothetical protein [Flavipsychrobacter sp.]